MSQSFAMDNVSCGKPSTSSSGSGAVTSGSNIVINGRNPASADEGATVNEKTLEGKTQLHRALKSRHVSMIAMGGAIGTGLIVSSGKGLASFGPAPLFISFTIIALLVWVVMSALGEMATWLPLGEGFQGYAARFCDESLAFAVGYTYLFKYLILTPNQLTAGAMVLSYWVAPEKLNPALWVFIFHIVVIAANYIGVRWFGEIEFYLSALKVLILLALMIFMTIMTAGGLPSYHVKGGWPWINPGAFRPMEGIANVHAGTFLTLWAALSSAVFAYLGTELIGVTVGEAENPRRNIPRAIKLTFWRVLFFYCATVLLLGLNLPYNSEYLQFANGQTSVSAAASPFVALMKQAGIVTLSGGLNGSIVVFILSSANSDLYIGTRTLYGLAIRGAAPRVFARTNKSGVPYWSLLLCSVFACLAYVVAKNDATEVFGYFVELVTVNGLLTWMSILYCHICFIKARRAQNVTDLELKYKAPFGIVGSYIGLVVCVLFLLTKGLEPVVAFTTGRITASKFAIKMMTSYLGIILYIGLIVGHKSITKTKIIKPADADLFSQKAEIDQEEQEYLERQALNRGTRSKWEKIYDSSLGYIL